MSSLGTARLIQWCSIMLPDPNGPGQKAECRKIAVFTATLALPHKLSNSSCSLLLSGESSFSQY